LRELFVSAKKSVNIVDSHVDENTFDKCFSSIPNGVITRLLYFVSYGNFDSRVKDLKLERGRNFIVRQRQDLHDRFLIVDGQAYILGTSINKAAENKPTLIVKLSPKDSKALEIFFYSLWQNKS
jgi:hypothetical protein